jgi:hypothetical protein
MNAELQIEIEGFLLACRYAGPGGLERLKLEAEALLQKLRRAETQ